jgi:streptogramin lyase
MNRLLWKSALLAVSLAACSNNSSTVPFVSPPPQGSTEVTFTVVVPNGTSPATKRHTLRPRYISPATQSVVISLDGTKLLTMEVDATSSACKSADSARTCSARKAVPSGKQTFHVTAYDGLQGTGNVLATGDVSKTLVANTPQAVNISLRGVVASLALSPNNAYPNAGTATTVRITLTAFDADGNAIVGSFGKSIRLADSDTTGTTKLSTTNVSSSSNAIALSYDGAPLTSATLTATAAGVPSASTVFAPAPTAVALYTAPPLDIRGRLMPPGLADICIGPDGNIWVTAASSGAIEKITPDGKFTPYLVPYTGPIGISVGSNHNLWFVEQVSGKVAQITTSGKVTAYKVPVPAGKFSQLNWTAPGPDGRTWFVDQGIPAFGAVTPDGKMTLYRLGANSIPNEIVAGPDGNLWMTDSGANTIDVISTSGKIIATHPLPTANASPWGITVGPDKNIWFAEFNADLIGRMTTAGALEEFNVPTAAAGPLNVAAGPNGTVWFTESGGGFDIGGKIGYLTTDGSVIRDFPALVPHGPNNNYREHVHALAFGANGTLWFTQFVAWPVAVSDLGKFIY